MKKLQTKKAFTLVELIIVITILAILATVGFLSFTSYTRDARDSNRITSLSEMWKWLDMYKLQNSKLPLPDNTQLTLSAKWQIIGYRWTLGSQTASSIKASSIAVDPLSKSNFAYWVDYTRKKYQLSVPIEWDLSNTNFINNTYADTPYKAKVIWNFSWSLNFSTGWVKYTATIPSLIYNYSWTIVNSWVIDIQNDKNNIYYVVDSWKNLPYSLDSNTINNQLLVWSVYKANTTPPPPQWEFFDSIWNTTYTTWSVTANNQIKLALVSWWTYNFTVDWWDGITDTITTWNQAQTTHTYATGWQKEIKIKWTIIWWSFNNSWDKTKLLEIKSWGPLNLWNNWSYFYWASNMKLDNLVDILDLSGTTNMASIFSYCSWITTVPYINLWDTSKVTNMRGVFYWATNFNSDISWWDTSNVNTTNWMFSSANKFNQAIWNWNTSNLTDISYMFQAASVFNQSIWNWNTSNIKKFNQAFRNAVNFNQDIWSWDTSSWTDMSYMFSNAQAFNQPLNNWNTSNVTNMNNMFNAATNFNQPIWNWNTSNVTDMNNMFSSATNFNQNISSWNTSKVTDISYMFQNASSFNQNIWNWDTSNINQFTSTFQNAINFNNLWSNSLNNWNTSSWIIMLSMFMWATNFNQPIWLWNTSKVNNITQMFQNASSFNQNISSWNTSAITSMSRTFYWATTFNQNLSSWIVNPNVTTCTTFASFTPAWVLAKPGFTSCTP